MSNTIHMEDVRAIAGIGKALGYVDSILDMDPQSYEDTKRMREAASKAKMELTLVLQNLEALGRFADMDLSPGNLRRLADEIEGADNGQAPRDIGDRADEAFALLHDSAYREAKGITA